MAANVRYNKTDQRDIVRWFLERKQRSSLSLSAERFVYEQDLNICAGTLNAWVRKWRDVVEEKEETTE